MLTQNKLSSKQKCWHLLQAAIIISLISLVTVKVVTWVSTLKICKIYIHLQIFTRILNGAFNHTEATK